MSRTIGGAFLAAIISLFLGAASAVAQTNEGRILGTVTDSQGKIVVGAKVVVTNTGTNAARTLQTNQAGDYVAPNLQPGLYTITAEASGFKKVEHAAVRLEVANDVRIDFHLVPGMVSETVRVTAEAPLITTTNDSIGGTLSNKEINDLPLNGRDYQNLVVLRPGVVRFRAAVLNPLPLMACAPRTIILCWMAPTTTTRIIPATSSTPKASRERRVRFSRLTPSRSSTPRRIRRRTSAGNLG